MAHQKTLKLAFCRRSLLPFHGNLSSSCLGKLTRRHLWAHSAAKEVTFASHPTVPITLECLVNLRMHRGIISRYSTTAGDGQTTQKQISGALADSSKSARLYLVGLGGLITIVGGYFIYHSKERPGPIEARKPHSSKQVLTGQKATIGGPFTLSNHRGEVVTAQDLIGHWTLIYFGYTSCPDDCPEELQKLAEAVEMIDEQTQQEIMPVFVTIDPKRDSAAQLQAYLSEFHPRFIGLIGTVDGIRQITREYRVFYKKVEDEGSDYLVDHSNLVYLMNPNMEFVKFFGKEYDARTLSMGIIEEMKKYKGTNVL